jgi:hypothetical protein
MAVRNNPLPLCHSPTAIRDNSQRRRRKLWSRLSAAMDAVLETRQLFDTDGAAGM